MRAIANGCREVTEHVFTVGFEEKEAEFCKEEIAWQIKPLYQLVFFQEIAYLASEELDSKRLHPLAKGMKNGFRQNRKIIKEAGKNMSKIILASHGKLAMGMYDAVKLIWVSSRM